MTDSPEKQEFQAVLQRAAAGDQDAWRIVVEAFSPRVFALVRSQCGDAELAEEITQSAFCTIASKLASYTEVGRFEQWIFRIAMNRLRDEMRRRKRHARPVEETTLTSLAGADESEGPAAYDESGMLAKLRQALTSLPEADQRIIHMRHFGELSFRQIADILDQPIGTVLARQHRALKKLRDLMGGEAPDEGPEAGNHPP